MRNTQGGAVEFVGSEGWHRRRCGFCDWLWRRITGWDDLVLVGLTVLGRNLRGRGRGRGRHELSLQAVIAVRKRAARSPLTSHGCPDLTDLRPRLVLNVLHVKKHLVGLASFFHRNG